MDRVVDLKDGKCKVTGANGFNGQEILHSWATVSIDQFVWLESLGEEIFGAWILEEAEIDIGALLIVVWKEKDQSSFFGGFWDIVIVAIWTGF